MTKLPTTETPAIQALVTKVLITITLMIKALMTKVQLVLYTKMHLALI